ncbi:restriction endonuclease [Bacillus sp. JJ1521]|uniref:restriction endonuclease n=1 Tax=Bacillus sp. JJ1521 TaxID=3122957 RepID=UPI002FFF68E7
MNRGYAGFYKGHYLRSSYEYAYAKYLDFHSIPWSYEDKNFDIGYKVYKPDFFFYGKNGELIKIVEIKSRNTKAKEEARRVLEIIAGNYNVECELLSYEELLNLYISLPFSLNSVITEWINSEHTTINKAAYGELNGHYNLRHSESTKKLIGKHTKQLWANDSVSRQKMLEGLRKSGIKKGYIKTPREIRVCKHCTTQFETLITSSQKFCSQPCAAKVAIKKATIRYVEKRQDIHHNIKDYIIRWTDENKDIVSRTPFNRIKTTISPLLIDIQTEFGVKDFRVISKAVFGEDLGRKELLKFMKSLCN